MSQRCFVEGCEAPAPFGIRFPGPRSEVPQRYRGYLWHCERHTDEAVARRDLALDRAKADGSWAPVQLGLFGGEEARRKA
jgi:hypothetical protein